MAYPQNEESKQVNKPFLFRSYYHRASDQPNERNRESPCKKEIWKIARATTAAPSYFSAMDIEGGPFLDGGLGANNPTSEAWYSIKQEKRHNDAVQVIVSLGTGKAPGTQRKVTSYYHRAWRVDKTMRSMATDSELVHRGMKKSEMKGYYRLNVKKELGNHFVPLDACKGIRGRETLDYIRRKTKAYLDTSEAKTKIRDVAERLVTIRRDRSNGSDQDKWEEFCYGLEYKCTVPECEDFAERHKQRLNLKDHLARRHPELHMSEDALLDAGKCYSVEVRE